MAEELPDAPWAAPAADALPDAPWAAPTEQPAGRDMRWMQSTDIVQKIAEPALEAFGHGFKEGYGPERLGLSKDSVKELSRLTEWPTAPFEAVNGILAHSIAAAPEVLLRAGGGLLRGYQGGIAEAFSQMGMPRLGRDLAAMPEAFFGSPHLGVPRVEPKPFVKPEPIRPIEGSPAPDMPRVEAARTGIPHVDAILDSPTTRDVITNPVIDRSHDVPYMAGGSVPFEDPTIYIDRHVPREQTVPRASAERIVGAAVQTDDGTIFTGVHHGEAASKAKEGGYETGSYLKRSDGFVTSAGRYIDRKEAKLIAERQEQIGSRSMEGPQGSPDLMAHQIFDENGKPYKRDTASPTVTFDPADPWVVHENVEQHVMEILIKGGMKPEEAYRVAHFDYAEQAEGAWYRAHDIDQTAAEAEQQSWLPRIQHENVENPPPNLYEKPYPHASVKGAAHESVEEPRPTPEESIRAQQIIEKHAVELQGEPTGPDLAQARDLGVIGPERPPITEGKPAEAAAEQKRPETKTMEVGEGLNPWQQRFEQFVGKLDAPEDVKQLIRDAAKENEDFMPARQGDIQLGDVERIAEAAGVGPEEINQKGLGRLLRNDAEVRTAMKLMLEVTKSVTDAARDVRAKSTPESLIKLQEAIMRRDLAVEQVVGLRAEWGRTGNVFQEFLRDVKDQEALSAFLKDKGRNATDLRNIADAVEALDGPQAARFLNDMRKPSAWDKFIYYWVNALISGPVTHTKYVVANAAFAAYESAVVTPIAAVSGAVRRVVSGSSEGVYLGEAGARMWGIVAGTPDAIVAAAKAARTGLQTALPGEVAQNIVPKMQRTIAFQQKPIEGILGTAIGIPSRGASAIHSFFNFLGYRASMEAQAYRLATKEGLRLTDDAFWQRRADLANAPTVEMMNEGIGEGYRLTYINELSPTMKKVTQAVRATKVGQLVMPFMHIPFNILARGIEGTPIGFLGAEMRADFFGKNGAVKQDMAIARLVAGSAVGAWAVNLVASDRMSGFGPTDPKERAQWLATGHQPYSIRIGDYWYSFNRFGSLGTMLGIHANLAEAIPHMKADAEELTKALTMTVHATGRLMEDEVGMQGLAGLIEAINEPERKGQRFVSNFAASLLPYSSLLRQTASASDPYMREAKTVTDGLRYYVPAFRTGLLPKRDWLGQPITNAGYGGDLPVPGVSAVIQHRAAGTDPLAFEMKALDLHPAPPTNHVGGVKLPPQMYDRYQTAAGAFTRQALDAYVNQPGWRDLPSFVREEIFKKTISATRQAAGAMMQMQYPQIIQQGIDNKVRHINGEKPTKLHE